ncbi:glucuronate isomerase [Clostridium tetanomorphum]|uniref:Uronate isomerase n=1 Tax=Clostridium tetanomorphum TaxID=1553 RepID=A0A923E820_CLOTT|nr:glucuronate isomerase [Clostridium tetanomorphum]KAJ52600.1 glucuronate isomerase [Clostridium tetanomorphum DSM 665]MBC2396846.1 glucuronate isomerase [Clostridium tetanomorphum]MBP1863192.1 glucuronate isomerase [Clostridium tetanomorphum]NRS84300.1 glucuronate isomerase [Clostridium tetanomorphum]NRZ97514.1 glucuronate isomerase [Clostridium tetanomorphum]
MRKFMDENFLLSNDTAINLYNNYAKNMPIIDYHCHLNPQEIFENKKFKNITEAWLYADHYKWRAMRSNGIDEKFITGDASDYEKFMAWAKTMPMAIGNPLYHWTHLELQRYFGIYDVLSEKTAPTIWEKANKLLNGEGFGARDLINKSNVKILCTTDDPTDSLEYHIKLKEDTEFNVKVLPALRPDKGLQINADDFTLWIEKLEKVYKKSIKSYDEFLKALESRVRFFHSVGCRISDHGFSSLTYVETSKEEVEHIFTKALKGEKVTKKEESMYVIYTLQFLGRLYSELAWTMQLHIGALRNNNTKMFRQLGPDAGFDSINDEKVAYSLSRLLDSLEAENSLPKTILYTLNPKDNYVLSTMLGNFQGAEVPGKIQFGSAWWFLDNKEGMIEQMKTVANTGLLSRFVGMLTDSRSFLSYTRHEYFRRILCNLIGEWVENGEVPDDMEFLGSAVEGICFNNAKNYFGIEC